MPKAVGTCGYTPEQMLCIVAYRNANHNKESLQKLLKTKLLTSLLKQNCTIAQKIHNSIKAILKSN